MGLRLATAWRSVARPRSERTHRRAHARRRQEYVSSRRGLTARSAARAAEKLDSLGSLGIQEGEGPKRTVQGARKHSEASADVEGHGCEHTLNIRKVIVLAGM